MGASDIRADNTEDSRPIYAVPDPYPYVVVGWCRTCGELVTVTQARIPKSKDMMKTALEMDHH